MKALTLLLLLFITVATGQELPANKKARTHDDYKARTLKEIFAMSPDPDDLRDKQDRMMVTRDIIPSRVLVTYSGSTRKITDAKKEVIRQWARLYAGSMEHYTTPYQTEMRFIENDVSYWLAVPTSKVKFKKGQRLEVYLIRLGATVSGEKYDWVLLTESVK